MVIVTWKGRPAKRRQNDCWAKQRSRGRREGELTQGCPWKNWESGIRKIQNEKSNKSKSKGANAGLSLNNVNIKQIENLDKLRISRGKKQRKAKPHVGEREKKIPMTARPSGCPIASPEMTFNEIGFPRTPGLSYFRGKKKLNFSQEIWVLSGNFGKRNFEYSPILAYFELKCTRWSSRGKGRPPIWCSDPLKICCRNISPYRFYRSEPLDIFLT